jgi:uncharacterized protein (TIGR02118 family)
MPDHSPITIYFTYAGTADTPFDRKYYVEHHLPLVLRTWKSHGLLSAAAFFPQGDGAGTIAIAECRFRDEAAIKASLAAPETAQVMADVARFTKDPPTTTKAICVHLSRCL